jgi:hypothetical protein
MRLHEVRLGAEDNDKLKAIIFLDCDVYISNYLAILIFVDVAHNLPISQSIKGTDKMYV